MAFRRTDHDRGGQERHPLPRRQCVIGYAHVDIDKQSLRVLVYVLVPLNVAVWIVLTLAVLRWQRNLSELDRQKSLFLATVTHEMRTPLNAIHGNAQLVLEALHIYEEMPDATTRFPRIPSLVERWRSSLMFLHRPLCMVIVTGLFMAPAADVRGIGKLFARSAMNKVLKRDLARDAATTATPLTRPRTVFRYTTRAQARHETRHGLAIGNHMTS